MENLISLRNELHEQLTAALNDGDADSLIKIDGLIKEIEPRILAAELSDLQSKIEKNVNRRSEIGVEIKALYDERAKRQRVVNEVVDLYNKARTEVAKVDYAIEMNNIELQTISVSNREMRERIDALKTQKLQEVNNGRFSK